MDNFKLIAERRKDLANLYQRMDGDADAVRLKRYTLTGISEQYKDKPLPDTVSMTMNDPQVFATAITAILQNAKRQTVVEGLSDTQNKLIEDFIDACFWWIEQDLAKRLEYQGAWKFACNHVAIRGPIGARITWGDDGKPHHLPVDMRYCPFDSDSAGLVWAANVTRRNAAAINAEYPDAGVPADAKSLYVCDFWNKTRNEVYLTNDNMDSGTLVFDQENPYGEVPFVIRFPTSGFMLLDEDYLAHAGESIFAAVRDLYPEWNRLMSIQQTKAMELIKPGYTHETEDPAGNKQPYPGKSGANTPVLKGEKPELVQKPDINNAFQGAQAGVMNSIQKGSINEAELGATQLDRTALWINTETELRNRILTPRFECLTSFEQGRAEMLIRQFIKHEFKGILLGRAGFKKEYSCTDLGDPDEYTVSFTLMPENSRQDLANRAEAIAMKGTISHETIIRDIIKCDDPDGEIDRLHAEEARQLDPIILYFDDAMRLIDVAEKVTGDERKRKLAMAGILADRMVDEIKRRKGGMEGQGTQDMQVKQGNANPLLTMPKVVNPRMGVAR